MKYVVGLNSEARFNVVDGQGRIVSQGILYPGLDHHYVDSSKLSEGMYYIRIEEKGEVHTAQMVITR